MTTKVLPGFLRSSLFLHASVFLALTIWSWRKWPDPLIDFGRELYIPWQLTTGKVLYRDIASLFGPFSPYLNSLWFTLFGVSLTTLIVCNLAILGGTVAGIYHLLVASTDRFTATAASMATLLLFGFSQYTTASNYNFVCPYAHEATHGIALAVVTMIGLHHGIRDRRVWPFAGGGTAFGLLLLTKTETSLAMVAAAGVGIVGVWLLGGDGRRIARAGLLLFVGFAAVAPLLFLLHFWSHMPLSFAAHAIGNSWVTLLTTRIASTYFYRRGMGLNDPIHHAVAMLRMFGGFVVFIGALRAVDHFWPPSVSSSRLLAVGRWAAGVAAIVLSFLFIPWIDFPRALPLISISAFAVFALLFVRRRHDRAAAAPLLPLLMWSAFATVLLAKIFLNARLFDDGFYLALPAVLVLVVVLLWLVPKLLEGAGARGRVFRAVSGLVLASGVAAHVALSNQAYRLKHLPVGSGGDTFLAFGPPLQWRGADVQEAVARIRRATPADATLAVLPEGVMINYLSRRENPTPYVNLMLPEVVAFGERNIRNALDAAPPDYILLVFRDTSVYGVASFGVESRYGREIMDWVDSRYETIDVIGERPVRDGGRGIEFLKRRSGG